MVYRTRPRMTEDGGLRRRTKFLIFLVFLCGVAICFYSWNYRGEHIVLEGNYKRVIAQGKKYASAYVKCDRNLKTSKGNLNNVQRSNTEMQTKVATQEKEIAELDTANNDAHMKLQNSYQFFLDAKDLIGNDQSISEDHSVSADAAEGLKKEITNLKSDRDAYERLKKAHAATLQALEDVKKMNEEQSARTAEIETQNRKTKQQNKVLKRMKLDLLNEMDAKNKELEQKEKMIKKLSGAEVKLKEKPVKGLVEKLSFAVGIPATQRPATTVAQTNPPTEPPKLKEDEAIGSEKRIDEDTDVQAVKVKKISQLATIGDNIVRTPIILTRPPKVEGNGEHEVSKEETNKEEEGGEDELGDHHFNK